jgi:hypothetical protein
MAAARTIGVTVDRPWREVYEFAARPENFARWASGLGTSLEQVGGEWFAAGPEGRVKVRFTPRNDYGVLDHHVTLASGAEIYVPMRVIANGAASEVLITLFRLPEMSDAKFAADAEWIARDLGTLKAVLEGAERPGTAA